jgi:branched-chain amino acid transport system substrate-binding protein
MGNYDMIARMTAMFSRRPRGGACLAPPRGERLNGALLFLVFLALSGCTQRGPSEPLWIGHVAPLSGSDKTAGEQAQRGIRLAITQANADPNLVLGRKVAVRHADSRGGGRDAEAEAVRLVSVNRVVALLGGTDAVQSEHLIRSAESAGVPVVVQAAPPAESLSENAFCCTPSLSRRGNVLAHFVARDGLKAETIALVVDERDRAAVALADAFRSAAPKDSVARFSFQKTEDLADVLVRAAKGKPRAIVLAGSVRDLPRLWSQLQKASFDAPLVFAGEDSALAALVADRDMGENVYAATSYLGSDPTSGNADFSRKYQAQYQEPPDGNAALAYDGARILFEAIRAANRTNAANMREALAGLQGFESVTGPLTFGEDHFAKRPLFVVQIKQGQATLVRRYAADEP